MLHWQTDCLDRSDAAVPSAVPGARSPSTARQGIAKQCPERDPLPGRALRSNVPRGISASVTNREVMASFMAPHRTAREQVDHDRDAEPALRGPDISEVGDPLRVRPGGVESPVEGIGRDDRPVACILWKTSTPWPGAQTLQSHRAFDRMQPAIDALGQHVVPGATCTIGPVRPQKARFDPRTDMRVAQITLAARSGQPGMDPAPRHTESVAHPADRPDPSVLRHAAEHQIWSLAKSAAALFRMSRFAFSFTTSRRSRRTSSSSGETLQWPRKACMPLLPAACTPRRRPVACTSRSRAARAALAPRTVIPLSGRSCAMPCRAVDAPLPA